MQMLQMEGKKPKVSELLVKMFEATKVISDADQYFEDIQQEGGMNGQGQVIPGGEPGSEGGVPAEGAMPAQGMGGRNVPVPGVAG